MTTFLPGPSCQEAKRILSEKMQGEKNDTEIEKRTGSGTVEQHEIS